MLDESVERSESCQEKRSESCFPCTGKPGKIACMPLPVSGSEMRWL